MNKNKYWVLIFSGVVLCAAFVFQIVVSLEREDYADVKAKLAKLDLSVPGWTRRDLPIAETEFLTKKAESILRYDDYRYVEYTKGNKRFSLYIAYWSKGKISPKEISWHNPDVCWVGNGFSRVAARSRIEIVVNGVKFKPAEEREYVANGQSINVLFWHLVDGRSRRVTLSGIDPWYAFITDMMKTGLDIKKEQFFVRVSSNVNWSEFMSNNGGYSVFNPIADLVVP